MDISAASALGRLRSMLCELNVESALAYRTHDFRRGHARDLQENGSNLRDILQAGEWRSPAFLAYLDIDELSSGAVLEAHLADEDAF